MPDATSLEARGLRERFEGAGQGHVFHHWGALDQEGRRRFAAELDEVDLDLVAELGTLLAASSGAPSAPRLEPPELFRLRRDASDEAVADEARAHGASVLAAGRVGFVLVAGGQGSRLGYDGPKGCFPVGPVSDAPLFAWHAARLIAAGRRHGFRPNWYVMTSRTNDAATREFFQSHDHFGLETDQVVFFSQAMLPALDPEGRIVLREPGALFLAPNGHGGSLQALASSGCLDHMRERRIDQISYFQVDSPLARPADPLFLGLHDMTSSEMSSKVVAKRDANEKVGVIGSIDGRLGCIEYSDLSEELRTATDADGDLLFRAGNIALHAIRRDFVEGLTSGGSLRLPWHLARKTLQTIEADGQPAETEGVKFETFVFDALGEAQRSVTLEVDRALEFSPVKNAEGEDSPATCREHLTQLFASWLEGTPAPPAPVGDDGLPQLEVDPRRAEDADEFRAGSDFDPDRTPTGHMYR